ncbi:hypothetical protein ACS126_09905 [Sphingobacterium lactis]|uniref:hypothetical protein n=1 Tax=Sphingobacterium lactis TaxID=797291 RepID=UPI003EC91DB3
MIATFDSNSFIEESNNGKISPKGFFSFVSVVNTLTGVFGSVILFPAGFAYGSLVLYKLKKENSKLKKEAQELLNQIDTTNSRQLKLTHLKVENLYNRYKSFYAGYLKTRNKKTVYEIILSSIDRVLQKNERILSNLESTIKKAAYPSFQRELSFSQIESLKKSFEKVDTSDWDSEDMDEYVAHYF